jgi:hypothetical protein
MLKQHKTTGEWFNVSITEAVRSFRICLKQHPVIERREERDYSRLQAGKRRRAAIEGIEHHLMNLKFDHLKVRIFRHSEGLAILLPGVAFCNTHAAMHEEPTCPFCQPAQETKKP